MTTLDRARVSRTCLTFALALTLGCSGQIATEVDEFGSTPTVPPTAPMKGADGGAVDKPQVGACDTRTARPGVRRLRRLSALEFRNTVADLTGYKLSDADVFLDDVLVLGYDNNAGALGMGVKEAQSLLALSTRIAESVAAEPGKFAPCAAGAGEGSCATAFVDAFGKRAWRRPLSTTERQRLIALYDDVKQAGGTHTRGLVEVTRALLNSPKFMFRAELGSDKGGGLFRLSDHEIASALSYLFWQTTPDAELLAAADAGRLSTPDELAKQARRLATDPRARGTVARFLRQYAGVYDADKIKDKNTTIHKTFRPELGDKMFTEFDLFLNAALEEGKGKLSAVMSGNFTVVDRALATYYGLPAPSGSSFTKVSVDGKTRRGMFTQGAYLATHAQAIGTAPMERGIYVRERFLCTPVPPPPPGELPALEFESKDVRTTRQRFVAHATNPACAGCHLLFDQLGFAFENYDAVGLYRTTENGAPVDASGSVVGVGDADGAFANAIELAQRLNGARQFQECFVRHAFRFTFGRGEDDADACTIQNAHGKALREGDLDVTEVLVAFATSDGFLNRRDDR